MTDAVNDPFVTPESNKDYLSELVGEGKKYADAAALAKAVAHGQTHIATLETELASLRTQAANGMNVEKLVEALEARRQANEGNLGHPQGEARQEATPQNIEEIVLNTIQKAESTRTAKQNRDVVVAKMSEVWGADSNKKLSNIASSLGVSLDYLDGVAKQSPDLFFTITGLNARPTPVNGAAVPTSTVSFGGNASNKRDASFYREMRKSNPKLWYDQKTQIQYQRDAIAQGEDFFN